MTQTKEKDKKQIKKEKRKEQSSKEEKQESKNKKKKESPTPKKKKTKKKKLSIFTIICGFFDLLAVAFFIVVYMVPNFKTWWITTALATGNHKYFANVLYSKEDIDRVLTKNNVEEFSDNTDVDAITFHDTKTDTYESRFEEQILKRDEGNDLYKVVEIDEKDYRGYLVVIYDAARVSLVSSSKSYGQKLTQMSQENNAIVAINASGFSYAGGHMTATGTVIQNGKVTSVGSRNTHGGGLVGFTKNHVLMLTTDSAQTAIKNGMWDAMTFGPFLIVNGKPATVKGNGGWGIANRTAIAQRKDGIVLFLVIDGRGANNSEGISIADMITLLQKYKAYNAANLDGGGSSTLVINGKLINNPSGYAVKGERYLPNSWMVK